MLHDLGNHIDLRLDEGNLTTFEVVGRDNKEAFQLVLLGLRAGGSLIRDLDQFTFGQPGRIFADQTALIDHADRQWVGNFGNKDLRQALGLFLVELAQNKENEGRDQRNQNKAKNERLLANQIEKFKGENFAEP